ncbi:MAG: apolipoprotein N-acyltransferase [PVC group bacterium]
MRIHLRDIGWALLSGLLLTLPFLDFSLAPLAWIALIPLIVTLSGRRTREGAVLGWLAGVVSGYGGMYWLARVTVPGYGVLGFYLALYPAAWGGWISWLSRRRPGWIWWAAPAGWTALEYLRTYFLTGFPWNLLGISQARHLPLIQIASVTGVYGVSFLVVLANASLAGSILAFRRRGARTGRFFLHGYPVLVAALVIGAVWGCGYRVLLLDALKSTRGVPLRVALIQGGVLQELKWQPSRAADHLETYLGLSRQALASGPGLIIWPESALPYYLEEQESVQRVLHRLAAGGNTYLLVGGDCRTRSAPRRFYNSAYLFSPAPSRWSRYDKIHLVPFGEYTPLKRIFPFLGRVVPWEEDFSAGEGISLMRMHHPNGPPAGGTEMGVLICFEDIFPGLARKIARRGASLLVNITNDAWYGKTIAPFQHAYAAVFRAVENGIYLARATNTGYSCIIDPRGKVVGEVVDDKGEPLFISGWQTVEIYPTRSRSFYTGHGDIFSWICIALALTASSGLTRFKINRVSFEQCRRGRG